MKSSLIASLGEVSDEATAKKYNVQMGTKTMTWDFVMMSDEDAATLRKEIAIDTMKSQGGKLTFFNGMPVVQES